MTTVLFWDIDGTLLTTARAGIFAWEEAFQEVLGRELDMSSYKTAGLTDAEIALKLADGDTGAAGRMLRRYAELLPERLHLREGHVLPNVRENLEALSARDDVVNMLLTGNVEDGAKAKLRHYRLWDYFARTGGAFSVEGSDRPSIARAARALITTPYDGDRTFVIGDTPHDISCGKAIGARTVAVATGPGYTLAELEACAPDVALAELPAPDEFSAVIASIAAETRGAAG
jgi:phosphoglycolate phosphatase-like HAD superfamily hydrolase